MATAGCRTFSCVEFLGKGQIDDPACIIVYIIYDDTLARRSATV